MAIGFNNMEVNGDLLVEWWVEKFIRNMFKREWEKARWRQVSTNISRGFDIKMNANKKGEQ